VLSINNTLTRRQLLLDVFFITIVIGLYYVLFIGSHALFTPDEGRYCEVAREMTASGDYITPRLNGVAFLDKPALYYWLQASAIHLFGLKEWSLRFWPALFGVFGCIVTYLGGAILFSRRTGLFAAGLLATSPLYYGAAHYANLDLEVAVLISSSLLTFLIATIATDKNRAKLLLLAYVFAGLAALTKGLIGLAFPMMIIGTWIMLLNRWAFIKKMRMVTGLGIFFAITLPWYILVQKANPEFLHFFFVTQQVSRFLTQADFNNRTVAWFYLPVVLAGLFPWTVFVLGAAINWVKKIWQNRQGNACELFLTLWLAIVFIFFSIPKSKTIGYILPVFPPLALMVGNYLDQLGRRAPSKAAYYACAGFVICCAVILLGCLIAPSVSVLEIPPELQPYLWATAAIYCLAGLAVTYFLSQKNFIKALYCMAMAAIIFPLILASSTGVLNQKSIKPLAKKLARELKPTDEVVTYFKYYQDLPIYLQRRVTIVADWQAPDIAKNDNWVRELWYGMPFQNTSTWLINDEVFWQRWQSNKRLYVFLNESYYADFAKKAQHSLYKLAAYKNIILVSNQPANYHAQ
jgi:4-amino-4-deoxy-L-arabinose transferase-like glycosyltransferase